MEFDENQNFKKFLNVLSKISSDIACIPFGSCATNKQKANYDIDICIIRKEGSHAHEFEELEFAKKGEIDIVFHDRLPDYIKFRVFSEGKILFLNNKTTFLKIRRKFLHVYRDNYGFYLRRMERFLANV